MNERTRLARGRSHGARVRTCRSGPEVQAKLYLPTATCGGGAPGTQNSLALPGTQHVGAQAPLTQDCSTSRRGTESAAEGRQSRIYMYLYIHIQVYIYIYKAHFTHCVSKSTTETDSVYIYIDTGYIDLVQFADTNPPPPKKIKYTNVPPLVLRDPGHEVEGCGNFSSICFSWMKIACF